MRGLQWPVLTNFGPLDCAVRGCDLWNDNNDADASARRVGIHHVLTLLRDGRASWWAPKLEGQSLDRG